MPALHDPQRHEPLTAEPWSATDAQRAIETIAADALRAFEGDALWPAHPLDEPESPDERYAMLYFGAGGVIWALRRLAALGAIDDAELPDFAPVVATLAARNRSLIESWGDAMTNSFIMGDAGLHLLHGQCGGGAASADALYRCVVDNLDHSAREPMWGSPGTMLAALHMAEATGEPRWAAAIAQGAELLWRQMEYDDALGCWLWRQQLYGRSCRYLGAAHGFAGNVHAVLRCAKLLGARQAEAFLGRALQTLQATARRDRERVNWPALADAGAGAPLVQDCHGAPGIVCRLAGAPRSAAWDELLNAAGEATWAAGPLAKGANLCHGSAGNGYAFLALYRRTGQPHWLERARAFAMHAIEQVERHRAQYGMGRWSLCTGDLGTALYLVDCMLGQANLPLLDVF